MTQLARQPARNDAVKTVDSYLHKAKDAIAIRLAEKFSADEMTALVHTSMRKTRHLAECDPLSIVGCVYEAAQVGLRPDAILGHCYLVPYRNGKRSSREKHDVYECQLIIGYKGMLVLAYQAGTLASHSTAVVYERDEFEYTDGTEFFLRHKPSKRRDHGKPEWTYCALRLAGGGATGRVIPWWRIEDLQKRAAPGSPWQSHLEAMAEKTAIRRACKGLPMSPHAERVMQLDARAEVGLPQNTRAIAGALLGEELSDAEFDDEDEGFIEAEESAPDAGKQLETLLDGEDPSDSNAP